MALQTLLFVSDRLNRHGAEPSHELLFMPMGSDEVLIHYARLLASQKTNLWIPSHMVHHLSDPTHWKNFDIRTYDNNGLAVSGHGRHSVMGESLLIHANPLPKVDIRSARYIHRRSRADISIFFDTPENGYCHEHVVTDGCGTVRRTVRKYADSSRNGNQKRVLLACAVSRTASHLLHCCPTTTFDRLARYIAKHIQQQGGKVQWLRTPAVAAHPSCIDSILSLIAQTATRHEQDNGQGRSAKIRLSGPLHIGHNVRIEPGAIIIGPAAIGDHVTIERNAVLTHGVVLPGTTVAADSCHYRRILGHKGKDMAQQAYAPIAPIAHVLQGPHRHAPREDNKRERLKRWVDAIAAALGLVLFSPLIAATAIAIKVTSPGPAFYRHRRQGLNGAEFQCLKFRTMIANAETLQSSLRSSNQVDGPQFKIVNDPRVTPLGRFLRRTNIDELPQLVNVLWGQMSLVGPRPSPDHENQYCPAWRKARLSVRPGITGLWQVTRSNRRSQCDFQQWIYYDLQYVEHRSTWLDVQILWQTVRILLRLRPSSQWRRRWAPEATGYPSYSASTQVAVSPVVRSVAGRDRAVGSHFM